MKRTLSHLTLLALTLAAASTAHAGSNTGTVQSIDITNDGIDVQIDGTGSLCSGGPARIALTDAQAQSWLSLLLSAHLAKKTVYVATSSPSSNGSCAVTRVMVYN